DAPQQRSVLILGGNGEVGEDEANDEDVVDRQCLLDEEAREILHPRLRSARVPDPGSKQQGNTNVEGGELEAFANTHLAIFLVEDSEIEGSQRCDQEQEREPEPS